MPKSNEKPQNLKNHARFDPPFHYFVMPAMFLNIVFCLIHAYKHQNPFNVWIAMMSIVLFTLTGLVRISPLRAQDRIIRLEERLRLAAVCPEPLRSRTHQLTPRQLIALRFAADDELADLAARALEEGLTEKQIKGAIKNWRADHCRV